MAMHHLLHTGQVANTTEFAQALGTKQPNISAIASGLRFATVDMIVLACTTYNISPTYLLLGTGPMFRLKKTPLPPSNKTSNKFHQKGSKTK